MTVARLLLVGVVGTLTLATPPGDVSSLCARQECVCEDHYGLLTVSCDCQDAEDAEVGRSGGRANPWQSRHINHRYQ